MNDEKLLAIAALQRELIKCLQSVSSEWDEDKSVYLQYLAAQSLEHVLEILGAKNNE